jgi:hypothetical protein
MPGSNVAPNVGRFGIDKRRLSVPTLSRLKISGAAHAAPEGRDGQHAYALRDGLHHVCWPRLVTRDLRTAPNSRKVQDWNPCPGAK